jgi:hypothetical protein
MTNVEIFPKGSKWRGELVQEGPEQSTIRITTSTSPSLVGQVVCFPNKDWRRLSEGKSSGRAQRPEYDRGSGAKTKERAMPDEETGPAPEPATDYVTQYNELVTEASAIGLNGYKPIATRFRDAATGAKRCEALAEAIEAHKAKVASGEVTAAPPETAGEEEAPSVENQESKPMARTATAKKAKKAAPAKKAAKVAAPKVERQRTGVVAEFGTREGTNREKVLLALYAKKNKPVALTEVAKTVYGKGDDENRLKVKAVIVGLNMMIEAGKLPYKPVEYEGRGEEATVTLASKSGR